MTDNLFFGCDERILDKELKSFTCTNILNQGRMCEFVPVSECPQKKAYVDLMKEKYNKDVLKDNILCLHCKNSSQLFDYSGAWSKNNCTAFPYCHQDISIEYMRKYIPDYAKYQRLVKCLSRSLHNETPEEFASIVWNSALTVNTIFFLTKATICPDQKLQLILAWVSSYFILAILWVVIWSAMSCAINELLTKNNQRYAFVRKHVENVQEKQTVRSPLPMIDGIMCTVVSIAVLVLLMYRI